MFILGHNDIFCGHNVVNFSVWFLQLTVFKYLVASHVTEPGSLLTEPGAVIKFSHFCSHPGTCLEVVSSIPAGSTIIYQFLCGFICVSLCQSIKIKPTNMYIASARAQFKISTHRCWNWHLCIPDGLSVVQCSHGHVIGVAFFGAISVAWSIRAWQLAAEGVASVWRSWVRSPPGPR